ncbi:MAG: hypothetical protein C0605_17535 [Hyphomicrobiales bacterium]|nr:MAG: hypothetical protein C0605_17535 [Hyphomicrobiales bacterium]
MAEHAPRYRSFRITFLLITVFGGLTALAVGLVLVLSAWSGLSSTRSLMREQALLTLDSFTHSIRQHLAPASNLIEYLRNQVERGNLDLDDREALTLSLGGMLAAAPHLSGLIIWKPDHRGLRVGLDKAGNTVFERIDNRRNEQFRNFVEKLPLTRGIVWGPPLRAAGNTYLYAYSALMREGKLLGVATASISSTGLSSYLDQLNTEYQLTPFVIYGRDHILAHPFLLTARSRKLFDGTSPLLKLSQLEDQTLSRMVKAPRVNQGHDRFDVHNISQGGGASLVISRVTHDYGAVPWRIGIYGPRQLIAAEMSKLRHSLLIGLFLLVLAVLLAVLLARRIAAPIKAFAKAATGIGHMDLERIPPLPSSHIRELNDQASAFNQMLAGLKQFETYIPKRLVERIISEGGDRAARSKSAELTIMFTDIFGFTTLSEKLPPAETAAMLNAHFELINQCIEQSGGTLDKYIGDAAMAFWGAPEQMADHARRAALTALDIAEQLARMPQSPAWPELRVKIALHTGPVIVGNIGARTRTNYTIIGDSVNICSRIEGLSNRFDDGGPAVILMSDDTARRIGEGFAMHPVGEFHLKGRDGPVRLWRLTGRAGES